MYHIIHWELLQCKFNRDDSYDRYRMTDFYPNEVRAMDSCNCHLPDRASSVGLFTHHMPTHLTRLAQSPCTTEPTLLPLRADNAPSKRYVKTPPSFPVG